MLNTTTRAAASPPIAIPRSVSGKTSIGQRIDHTLALLEAHVVVTRRIVHAGDAVYQVGDPLHCLYVVHSGCFKSVNLSRDGREQVVGLHFKGDWMGFDGIAENQHSCEAIAMDVGQVLCIEYPALMQACAQHAGLMALVHAAMSREIGRDRDSMMSLCTLPADARVAEFLRSWAEALADRGLRNDQITLRMTRAEIGNYLGMKLETVSRALSRLARDKVIAFQEKGSRDVQIPDVAALGAFVQRSLSAGSSTLQ